VNLLQVSPRYPPHTGGVEKQVQELSERLVDRGHEVTVVTADAGDDVERQETRDGVTVRRHGSLTPEGAIHFAPEIRRAVQQSDADLVHAHNVHSLPLPIACFSANAPVIATAYYHGASSSRWRNALWVPYRPVARQALRRARSVTAVSEWERRTIQDDFGVDPEVIPIGLETATFRNATPVDRDRPYILTVSRLEEYKGVQHAIRALPELPEYDLLVAGDGPYRDDLESVASEVGVADRVEFLGNLDHDVLPGYYAGAAAYCSFSEFESFGITVAEALASGTPAVVLEATALADWTTRSDVVGVSSVDTQSVAGAIDDAIGRDAPSASIATWEDTVDRYEDRYRATIETE